MDTLKTPGIRSQLREPEDGVGPTGVGPTGEIPAFTPDFTSIGRCPRPGAA